METSLTCPICHTTVQTTHYYCFNCGANLRPSPPSLSLSKQVSLYMGSIFLPPMGIIWGMRYLKQPDQNSKIVGTLAIILTVVSLVVSILVVKGIIDSVNSSLGSSMTNITGF